MKQLMQEEIGRVSGGEGFLSDMTAGFVGGTEMLIGSTVMGAGMFGLAVAVGTAGSAESFGIAGVAVCGLIVGAKLIIDGAERIDEASGCPGCGALVFVLA